MAVSIWILSGRRISLQFLTESAVLAALGGAPGVLVGIGGVRFLREFASPNAPGSFQISFGGAMLPRVNEIQPDGSLLLLAVLLAGLTAMLVRVIPALRFSQIAANQSGNTGRTGVRRRDLRLREVLVVGQVCIAMDPPDRGWVVDLTTYAAVISLFADVALVASYLPARLATGVNPTAALRSE